MISNAILSVANGETFFDPNVAFNFVSNYIQEYAIFVETNTIILLK
jgi:two-component system response regulator NreC